MMNPDVRYNTTSRGYTLIELIIAVGLFALIMLLASGAYLIMINVNRQTQSIATGIDNLSFALESMTRDIRTGTAYSCGLGLGDCPWGDSSFSFRNSNGGNVTYTLVTQQGMGALTKNGTALTDPSVDIKALTFYVWGSASYSSGNDVEQPSVFIVISGAIASGHGKTESFTIQTRATMRGTDL